MKFYMKPAPATCLERAADLRTTNQVKDDITNNFELLHSKMGQEKSAAELPIAAILPTYQQYLNL